MGFPSGLLQATGRMLERNLVSVDLTVLNPTLSPYIPPVPFDGAATIASWAIGGNRESVVREMGRILRELLRTDRNSSKIDGRRECLRSSVNSRLWMFGRLGDFRTAFGRPSDAQIPGSLIEFCGF